jgi:hypothetical protein
MQVAEGTAKNERERHGDQREAIPHAHQNNQNDNCGKGCEADQGPADQVRGGGFRKKRKGRAFVGPMGDAQNAGNEGDCAAHADVRFDPDFRQAVGKDDERGDEQEPG